MIICVGIVDMGGIMKEEQFTSLAEKLGISKSTVSKAYRHCSGVDTVTRDMVLRETEHLAAASLSSACDIYCIFPDIPHYFWNELRRGIKAGAAKTALRIKCNIITKISDEQTVLYYLDEAEHLGARVILLTAVLTPALRKRLASFPLHTCVILLSEYDAFPNCFYVGADAYTDGWCMGEVYAKRYRDRIPVLLHKPDRPNIKARLAGFRDALALHAPEITDLPTVSLPENFFENQKTAPSRLAAILRESIHGTSPLCLYVPFGSVQLPLALNKAKLSDCTVTLCHDDAPQNSGLPEVTGAVLKQDVFTQGQHAVTLAAAFVRDNTFPGEKNTFVPSHLIYLPTASLKE